MADLDPALVEELRVILFGNSTFSTDADVETIRIKTALGLLGIPAAALNAVAKGEAVVVPSEPNAEQESAGGYVVDRPSVFMGGPSRHGRRTARQAYKAMIAASPYRSDT